MYLHQVLQSRSSASILHFREKHAPSGLIESIVNIGQTVARMDSASSAEPRTLASGLIMPTLQQVERSDNVRADASERKVETVEMPEEIRCDDLTDFVRKGVARWIGLVTTIPGIRRIDAVPIERHKTTERTTASGLTVPGEPLNEFEGYAATIQEIEAIESIAARVPLPGPHQTHASPYI